MVSGLDHCLTSNLTAVQQCIVYTSEVSVSLHLMQCVCVWGGGGGGVAFLRLCIIDLGVF